MKISKQILSLILLCTLAACGTSADEKADDDRQQAIKDKKTEEAKAAAETYKKHLICPQVAIVRELATIRDYGDAVEKTAQLAAGATMTNIVGTCAYKDEGGIDISFTLSMIGAKGPALKASRASFPFFVAVLDPDQKILNKMELKTDFTFKSKTPTTDHDEVLHILIPLPKEKRDSGPDYRVLAGFQLTPDQLTDAKAREAAELQHKKTEQQNAAQAKPHA